MEIRIVGPQFSDPILFSQWLCERYGVGATRRPIRHDGVLEINLPGIHVLSVIPAVFDFEHVYDFVLDGAEAILLTLNRVGEVRRLNADVIALVARHARLLDVTPIVAANDPFNRPPDSPIAPEVPGWPVYETTIGPFERPLKWTEGAQEVWDIVTRNV